MRRILDFYTIVGDRPADLLSPLLDAHFRPGALRLFCRATNRDRAEAIALAARQLGKDAEIHQIPHARNADALKAEFCRWAKNHPPGTAVLNVSGADPLYAIPACDAFGHAGHPVFAVEPDSDWLIWLSKGVGDYASFNIADILTLPQFFTMHGLQWEGAQQTIRNPNSAWNQVALYIAKSGARAPTEIAELNRLACSVNSDLITTQVAPRDERPILHDLIDTLIAAEMVERQGDCLRFLGARERAFAAGGWLENRLFYAVRPLVLSGRVQDLASGVRIVGPGEMAAEWDVVFLANNNLHIIECKARAARKNSGGVGMETFFKLESLARLEGIDAHPMLATLARPTRTEASRAMQLGIEILVLKDGHNLTELVERWIDSVSRPGF